LILKAKAAKEAIKEKITSKDERRRLDKYIGLVYNLPTVHDTHTLITLEKEHQYVCLLMSIHFSHHHGRVTLVKEDYDSEEEEGVTKDSEKEEEKNETNETNEEEEEKKGEGEDKEGGKKQEEGKRHELVDDGVEEKASENKNDRKDEKSILVELNDQDSRFNSYTSSSEDDDDDGDGNDYVHPSI
jgi:hypothetical protein